MKNCVAGYNGERMDLVSGITHPGLGYRGYDPALKRFMCPDSASPSGQGGINSYAWCLGDPINNADPSGHHSVAGWLGVGAGLILGTVFMPVSGGLSLPAFLTAAAIVTSAGLEIAQQFASKSNPRLNAALGWAGIATGLLSGLGAGKSLAGTIARDTNLFLDQLALSGMRIFSRLRRINGAVGIPMSGEFRHATFIGIYPAGHQELHMALSFVDVSEEGLRLNLVGAAAWRGTSRLMMGSGRWNGQHFIPAQLSYARVAREISNARYYLPGISSARIAIESAGAAHSYNQSRLINQIEWNLRLQTPRIPLSAPEGRFEVGGPVVETLNDTMRSLHYDAQMNLMQNNTLFSPEIAQNTLTNLSRHYGNRADAFIISGGEWIRVYTPE